MIPLLFENKVQFLFSDLNRHIYVGNGKPVLSLMSLKSILNELSKDQFMRVNRSFIVPLGSILSIRNRRIYLDQWEIPIGDTYLETVKDWLVCNKQGGQKSKPDTRE